MFGKFFAKPPRGIKSCIGRMSSQKDAFYRENCLRSVVFFPVVMPRVLVSIHQQKLPISDVDLKQGYRNNHNLHSQSPEYVLKSHLHRFATTKQNATRYSVYIRRMVGAQDIKS